MQQHNQSEYGDGFICLNDVKKSYGSGSARVVASAGVSFTILEGEFCVIVGPSGAGKTTVLNLLGGMDCCDSGNIVVDGTDIARFSEKKLTDYRRHSVGFVFQSYNLMANLTALENVEIASEICRVHLDARETLHAVGLEERRNHFPSQLSGGEQQRVSIARALAKRPKLLLCDEPTGALDYETGIEVLRVLHKTCRAERMTTLVITHNQVIAEMADRVIVIRNGMAVSERVNKHPKRIEDLEW